jgi:hypothetical protein
VFELLELDVELSDELESDELEAEELELDELESVLLTLPEEAD